MNTSAAATNCLGDEEVLPDDQLFGAEPTTGGWGEAAEDSGADADTESDSEGDQKGVAEGSELDVWETALEQIVSDSTVMDGSDEMDEDAEWRQVARAEMLEEHYRGTEATIVCLFPFFVGFCSVLSVFASESTYGGDQQCRDY